MLPRFAYRPKTSAPSNLLEAQYVDCAGLSLSALKSMKLFGTVFATLLIVISAHAKDASPQMEHNAFYESLFFLLRAWQRK